MKEPVFHGKYPARFFSSFILSWGARFHPESSQVCGYLLKFQSPDIPLGGGFKHSLFSALLGKDSHFD